MKTKLILLTIILTLSLAFASYAEIPHLINFQGKATDKNGEPLNGTYKITFRIYDQLEGGKLKWEETRQDIQGIDISNGIFNVLLGEVTPLNLDFNENYWIAVEVEEDGEMIPRTRLASVGYAYRAEKANLAERALTADTLSGKAISQSSTPGAESIPVTDEDGFLRTPERFPAENYQVVNKKYVDDEVAHVMDSLGEREKKYKISGVGEWRESSGSTRVPVETDGFVLVIGESAGIISARGSVSSDTSFSNDEVRALDGGTSVYFTMPVRKGEYWSVGGSNAIKVYWMPLK